MPEGVITVPDLTRSTDLCLEILRKFLSVLRTECWEVVEKQRFETIAVSPFTQQIVTQDTLSL